MRSSLEQFIPRPDYSVFPLELPPLSRKDREQAVINKLRGFYPGNLDDKCIVVLPNGKRGACLALIFDDSLRDDPLSVSTLAATKLCKRGRQNCVIVWGGWVEYLMLDEGKILSSMVTAAEERLSDQLALNAAHWFGLDENSQIADEKKPAEENPKPVIKVFCAASESPAETAIVAGGFVFHYIELEKALVSFSRSACSCFPERLPEVKRHRRLLVAAACIAVVFLAFCFKNWYVQHEAAKAGQREAERLFAMEMGEQKVREEKLAALIIAWEEELSKQYVGVYATIETLASCLSPAIRLSSATFKEDGNFRLEGNAFDSIAALEDLQIHPDIKNAAIGTIVWDGNVEQFTVSGAVEQHRILPEDNLAISEKIFWYETALADSVKSGAMPETAAAAAQLVRDLLLRHRLKITRFRYLDADGGWGIECAVSGTGMQVVQVIKEADEAFLMKAMSLETRNRQNGVDAVITFFVWGPGEREKKQEYDAHPSLARIASLYGFFPVRSVTTPAQQLPVRQSDIGLPITPPVSHLPALLEYVGFIGVTEGRRYIYVKDTKSGELYRLAEGEGSYSYRVNSEGFIIATLSGSSTPVEVRRNDGF